MSRFSGYRSTILLLAPALFVATTACKGIDRRTAMQRFWGCPPEEPVVSPGPLGGLAKGSLEKIGGADYLDRMYNGIHKDLESDGVVFQKLENALQATGIKLEKISDAKGKTKQLLISFDGDLSFDTGKSDLSNAAKKLVDHLADALDAYPETTVSVTGHTDSTGSRAFNLVLSQRRAEAVKRQIQVHKPAVTDPRFTEVKGYADLRKIIPTNGPEKRNRRVEIRITPIVITESD